MFFQIELGFIELVGNAVDISRHRERRAGIAEAPVSTGFNCIKELLRVPNVLYFGEFTSDTKRTVII